MRVFECIEDSHHYYIVSELLAEELYQRLLKKRQLSESEASNIIEQILLALNYMHKKRMVHRDIKLENILMEHHSMADMSIKVTDFGFSKSFDPEQGMKETLGSPLYMAPEIIESKPYGF